MQPTVFFNSMSDKASGSTVPTCAFVNHADTSRRGYNLLFSVTAIAATSQASPLATRSFQDCHRKTAEKVCASAFCRSA